MEGIVPILKDFLAEVHKSNFPPDVTRAITQETDEVLFNILMQNIELAKSVMGDTMGMGSDTMGLTQDNMRSVDADSGDGGAPSEPTWTKVGMTKFQKPKTPTKPGPAGPGRAPPQTFHDLSQGKAPGAPPGGPPEFGRRSVTPQRNSSSPKNMDRRQPPAPGPRHEPAYRGVEHDLQDPQFRSMKKAIGRGQHQPAAYNPISGHFTQNQKRSPKANEEHTMDGRRRGSHWGRHDDDSLGNHGRKFAPRNSEPGGKAGLQFNSETHEQQLNAATRASAVDNREGYARFKARNLGSSQITIGYQQ